MTFSPVSHAEYNAFVQRAQAEAMAWGAETRVEGHVINGTTLQSVFEVYFDRWQRLGHELPFRPDAERNCNIDEGLWQSIQFEMAKALTAS